MLIGCDTGGTFTDFVLFDPAQPEQGLTQLKLSSTPDDPARAVIAGVELLSKGRAAERVNHASTVATNALLEGDLSEISLLTTAGFEDCLWLGRGDRRELYSLYPDRIQPPLSRQNAWGVQERVLSKGQVKMPLKPGEIEQTLSLLNPRIQNVAVLFLHSSINPEHELQVGEYLARQGFQAFLSHKIAPGTGEYDRGMTTVLAAALAVKVQNYLSNLAQALSQSKLSVVHSAGGLLSPQEVFEQPHRMALSGPAAGLRGALAVSQVCKVKDLVTLDMGGTSTDVALIADGQLPYCWQSEISGYPLRAPSLDIHTVGAGGGSLAWVDDGGLMRVGPKSAGAHPGPACYGRGGSLPTVTDALCWSGLLPDEIGTENLKLQKELSLEALSSVGCQLKLEPEAVTQGILSVCNAHLSRAVRRVTTAVGRDPKNFCLFPFGGAGPLLACRVAEALQIETILIPDSAGVLSAWGALVAPWEQEWSQTVPYNLRGDSNAVDTLLKQLIERPDEAPTGTRFESMLARRYVGQGETLVSPPEKNFHELHLQQFGFSREDSKVETVEVRLRRQIESPAARFSGGLRKRGQSLHQLGERKILDQGAWQTIPLFSGCPKPGETVSGPFLLFTDSATVLVADDWDAMGLQGGHMMLRRRL